MVGWSYYILRYMRRQFRVDAMNTKRKCGWISLCSLYIAEGVLIGIACFWAQFQLLINVNWTAIATGAGSVWDVFCSRSGIMWIVASLHVLAIAIRSRQLFGFVPASACAAFGSALGIVLWPWNPSPRADFDMSLFINQFGYTLGKALIRYVGTALVLSMVIAFYAAGLGVRGLFNGRMSFCSCLHIGQMWLRLRRALGLEWLEIIDGAVQPYACLLLSLIALVLGAIAYCSAL